jgi:FKBP-type peptidyl-prolyl cis-trans isomerase FklB
MSSLSWHRANHGEAEAYLDLKTKHYPWGLFSITAPQKEDFSMKHPLAMLLGITLIATPCLAAKHIEIKSHEEKINYSVGYQIGKDFKDQAVTLKADVLLRGISDAINGQPSMSQEDMHRTLIDLKKKIVAEQAAINEAAKSRLEKEGAAFLAENAKKEGIVVLPSGLQYKVLREGNGRHPTLTDKVSVNYRGTRINGREFSNTYRTGKPDIIELAKVIPGWREALPLMQEGAKWEMYIPSNLAFGESGPLEGNVVIYEVELLKVLPGK